VIRIKLHELKEGKLYIVDSYISVFTVINGHLEMLLCASFGGRWIRCGDFLGDFKPCVKCSEEFIDLLRSLHTDYEYITISKDGVLTAYDNRPYIVDCEWVCDCEDGKYTKILISYEIPFTDVDEVMDIGDILLRETTIEYENWERS